ncbi:hypothetical protein EJB05_50975, partial [Eragrostis curvula]
MRKIKVCFSYYSELLQNYRCSYSRAHKHFGRIAGGTLKATFPASEKVRDDICSLEKTACERSNNLQLKTNKLRDFTSCMREQWEGYMERT